MSDRERGGRLDWLPLTWKPGLSLRRHPDGRVLGRFLSAHLTSLFQPIVEVSSDRVVGSEAFVRCHNGDEIGLSPWNLFSLVADDDTLVGLDRLCRTLHVLNHPEPPESDALLFLNVHGRLLPAVAEDHGHAFRRVLIALDRPSANIVIETPATACADPKRLAFVLSNYRLNGFKVAANVSSTRELEIVLREVRPNFVKIDSRTFAKDEDARSFISLAASEGVRTIFTRVEQSDFILRMSQVPGVWLQGHSVAETFGPANRALVEAHR